MITTLHGDCTELLPTLPPASVQCIVTSPPYFGLRRYSDDPREIGNEPTPAEYVDHLVSVFTAAWRVLADDGTLFLNVGDSYAGSSMTGGTKSKEGSAKRAGRMFTRPARVERAQSYDNDGTAALGYQARGLFSGSPYDEHKGAQLLRSFGIDAHPAQLQALASLSQIQDCMAALSAHLPTVDWQAQRQIEQFSFANLDLVQTAIHEAEPLLSSLASKIAESSPQSLDALRLGGALSAYLSSLRSYAVCARRCAHTLGGLSKTRDYSHDIASLFAELEHHSRCTGACYSLVFSWFNPPYIKPQYTTLGRQKQGMPPSKSLIGIPWRVAFALQDAGWVLRNDIIWHKPSVMPESVDDRLTRDHEYLFLFAKRPHYYFNAAAIAEPVRRADRPQYMRAVEIATAAGLTNEHIDAIRAAGITDAGKAQKTQSGIGKNSDEVMRLAAEAKQALGGYYREFLTKSASDSFKRTNNKRSQSVVPGNTATHRDNWDDIQYNKLTRNRRTVWRIASQPLRDDHFAAFPEALVEPCILAGSRPGDTVLDMFAGSGTTLRVAERLQRNSIGIDLNADYLDIQARRTNGVQVELFV